MAALSQWLSKRHARRVNLTGAEAHCTAPAGSWYPSSGRRGDLVWLASSSLGITSRRHHGGESQSPRLFAAFRVFGRHSDLEHKFIALDPDPRGIHRRPVDVNCGITIATHA
jgi:hypothetical protein